MSTLTQTIRNINRISFLLVVLVSAATPLLAQITEPGTDQARPIDRPAELQVLEGYFQMALDQNPELASLRREMEAQQQRVQQVVLPPDPEVRVGFFLNPVTETSLAGRFSVSAMQMFPWFGTLDTRGEIEESAGKALFHSLNSRQLALFREIQELWFNYYRLTHHVHVHMEILRIVRDLEALVETRYETGQAGQADILRLQMEEQRLLERIEQLEDEMNPLREQFNARLNRDPEAEIDVPASLPARTLAYTRQELFEIARNHHPEFNRLRENRTLYRHRADLAGLEGRPSFGVGIEYMGRDFSMLSMMPDMKETFIGMMTVRVPLYRNRYRAQQREAELQLQATNLLESDLTNRLRSNLEEAMAALRDGQRQHRLVSGELLPRSEQLLEVISEEYRTGQAGFDEVLQITRENLALENEKIEALAAQNRAMARLEQLIANELYQYNP